MVKKSLPTAVVLISLLSSSHVAAVTFDFTGRLVVATPSGAAVPNGGATYTPISGQFDSVTGMTSISSFNLLGAGMAQIQDFTIMPLGGSLYEANILMDWSANVNIPIHVMWDGTGLDNAISYGLKVGDILSGTNLYRDGIAFGGNGNGIGDPLELQTNIFSATPYSDSLQSNPADMQGPAPLAAISGSMGVPSTSQSFPNFKFYFDIGSGHSMTVTSVSAVPVPSAVWLFGSGLIGLIGVTRRKCTLN